MMKQYCLLTGPVLWVGLGLVWSLVVPTTAQAQSIQGQVVVQGWEEPVAGALVLLLDRNRTPVDSVRANEGGFFLFSPPPGVYHLRASLGDSEGTVSEPVPVTPEDASQEVVLAIPSPLYDRAQECAAQQVEEGTGVLAGIVFDPDSELPVPNARVTLQWEQAEGAPRGVLEVETDASGHYAFCSVPAGPELNAWVSWPGVVSPGGVEFVLHEGVLARFDIPLPVAQAGAVRTVQAREATVPRSEVEGRVVDTETGAPVRAAAVILGEGGPARMTDERGRFHFESVSPGTYALEVRHLGYSWEAENLEVPESTILEVELQTSPRAIALAPIEVTVRSREARELRASPVTRHVLEGERLRFHADLRGASIPEIARDFPGVNIQHGTFESADGVVTGACIESRRAMMRLVIPERSRPDLPWCEMMTVVLDGAVLVNPGDLLTAVPASDIERMEYLPPLAATRWGLQASANGALVLWTRGRLQDRDRE